PGVHLARGGSGCRWPPTMADSLPRASFSRLMVCQSPPFSVAGQKHYGVRWAWMSLVRMALLGPARHRAPARRPMRTDRRGAEPRARRNGSGPCRRLVRLVQIGLREAIGVHATLQTLLR